MILYNTMTALLVVMIAAMLLFIGIAFKPVANPMKDANLPGKDYEGRVSDGIKASPGLSIGPQPKEIKVK